MNNIIEVNNNELKIKEYNGKRVVTFKDIDMVHERPNGTERVTFNKHKDKFINGEDYFVCDTYEAKEKFGIVAPNGTTLLTEQGYLMLVKPFGDDLAWDVQRTLVKSYFNAKDTFSNLSPELRAVIVVDQRVTAVEQRVDRLEYDVPLYAAEADELSQTVKKKGTALLGGKTSNAYKDSKLIDSVYRNIYNTIKYQFDLRDSSGKYKSYKALQRKHFDKAMQLAKDYELPVFLQEKVNNANAQIILEVA